MLRYCVISMAVCTWLMPAPTVGAAPGATASPALSRWVNRVISHHPEIQAARAAVEAADDRLRAAGQPLFNPELELEYENSDTQTTAGGVSQTLDWSGKRGARAAVAASRLELANAELLARRQKLATDLLKALSGWHTATAVARVSAKQTALMIRFARAAEQRRKAGDLGQVELDVAQLAAADAGLEQARADEALLRARRAMTALTGGEHADWPAVPEQLPDVDPQQLQVQRLLDSLPSMRAARARVATARATIRSRVRHTRPDPTVGLRVGEEDSQTLTGVTLSVPLFVRNSFRAEVDAASAELVQAEREAATLRQQARADLIAAAQIYENARSAWKHWQIGGAPRLSGATDLLERLWQTGELSLTDYLVQLKQALDSERSAAEQRGHVWRSWADWLAASGQSDQWLILPGDTP